MKLFILASIPAFLAVVLAADAPDMGPFVPVAGNVTATAILGWFMWRLTEKTIPAMLAAHEREYDEQRKRYDEQTKSLLQVLGEERQANRRKEEQFFEVVGKLAARRPLKDDKGGQ